MFMHINNASYLSLAEYARWAWIYSSNLNEKLGKLGLAPIIGCIAIRYRKQIRLFQPYTIKSKLIHFEDKAFYLVQKFYLKNQLACSILMKCFLNGKNGIVNPIPVFEGLYPKEKLPMAEFGSADHDGLSTFHALESFLLEKPIEPPVLSSSPSPSQSPVSSSSHVPLVKEKTEIEKSS
eukprot:MONOS_5531.1-p1 / transcript=MONOS_5531.1 / gene=MONOS_5531 / organism=Monocercomonoides_exilis_PA203 / gene_product=unspecified product / transcript_product=unspecified product / location=Mono_scaffold00162:50357-50893(-) / protein_length=178 / sequence_SO=supercontig / SO=protein_coding / is_pseudo=false